MISATPRIIHIVSLLLFAILDGRNHTHCAAPPTLCDKFLTLRVSPPAHPETMPRRVALIKDVRSCMQWSNKRGSRYFWKGKEEVEEEQEEGARDEEEQKEEE